MNLFCTAISQLSVDIAMFFVPVISDAKLLPFFCSNSQRITVTIDSVTFCVIPLSLSAVCRLGMFRLEVLRTSKRNSLITQLTKFAVVIIAYFPKKTYLFLNLFCFCFLFSVYFDGFPLLLHQKPAFSSNPCIRRRHFPGEIPVFCLKSR